MNTATQRAATRRETSRGQSMASPAVRPQTPEPSGLSQDEIRQIILDLLG